MKFVIGTNNKSKIEIARKVLDQIISDNFTIEGKEVDSGVPETPHDQETKRGAQNRAHRLLRSTEYDYAIGLESGLVERYGDVYEEAWCCVLSSGKETLGYSSGLKIPDLVVRHMHDKNMKHYEVMRAIKSLLPNPEEKDTWGNYSSMKLTRSVSFEEALRNALIQMFADSNSLYVK